MTYTVHHADALVALRMMADDSIDAIVTDPPYGLSEGQSLQSVSQRIYDALFKVGFPDLYERHAEQLQGVNLAGVSSNGAALGIENGAIRIEAGVSVPESAVDFERNSVVNQEINNGDIASGLGVANGKLSDKGDAEIGQFLGDFILKLGNVCAAGSSFDMPNSCLAEAFFGGFAVPVFSGIPFGLPSFGTASTAVVFGNEGIGFAYNTPGQAKSTSGVVALSGTINSLMLRFDLSGRPVELLATNRASELATVGQFGGTELVRAFPAASGLASIAEPCRVRFIGLAADGTSSDYWFHLWVPLNLSIKNIIPRGGFMGKQWDSTLPDPQVWREALRVLKPGGHLLAFGGTRTYHRMVVAIEDAGFEIRDQIQWIYGSGFPKSRDVSKAIDEEAGAEREVVGKYVHPGKAENGKTWNVTEAKGSGGIIYGKEKPPQDRHDITAPATPDAARWQGFGTALKPANEPICLARKPLAGTVAANVLEWGTGALNVDGCRIPGTWERNSTTRCDIRGGRLVNGESGGMECEPQAAHAKGRWPANVIHDGSEEVTALFPVTTQVGYRGNPSTNKTTWFGAKDGSHTEGERGYTDTGSAARFFYTAKASKRERDAGLDGLPVRGVHRYGEGVGRDDGADSDPNRPSYNRNHHPTVKPIALMRYLCRLITPPGGTVLDPFCGSGSTGCGAVLEGFNFVGIERETEYVEIARLRIGHWIAEQAFGLFEMAAD